MPAPIRTQNTAWLYFTGSYGDISSTATLFMSGTGNISSGCMPLMLLAKNTATATLGLSLLARSKTSAWETLSSTWSSYNISCNTGATYFCQDWEYIPYYTGQATGSVAHMTLAISGAYRGYFNAGMPLYITNSGGGLSSNYMALNMYAVNSERTASGIATLYSMGHNNQNGNITLAISGAYTNSTGNIDLYCQAYDSIESTIKLFVSGI